MASKKDYFSFDEVLSDLEMEEDELKRLVSAGEIRAFRDKDSMKFKADDVNRLRSTPGGEVEEIDLGDDLDLDDEPLDTDEVVVEEVEEIDLTADADDDKPLRPRRAAAPGAAPRARGARASAAATAQPDEQSEGLGMRALLIVLALLMVIGSVVTLDAAAGRSSNGISGFVANLFKS